MVATSGMSSSRLEAEQVSVNSFLQLEALVLNLEVEISLAEDVLILAGRGHGLLIVAGYQRLTQLAAQAAGEADETFCIFGEDTSC